MKSVRLAGLLVICLIIVGANNGIGQERKQSGKLEILPSAGLDVSYARLEEDKNPHLQYKVVNNSNTDVPKVTVEMIVYGAENKVLGGMRWNLRVDLKTGASTHGILATDSRFNSAQRATLKFVALNSGDESECNQEYCGPSGECGKMAMALCGTGIRSFGCQQGSPCMCKAYCDVSSSK